MKKSTIVCIVVVVLIFLAIIITCVQASIHSNFTKFEDKQCTHNARRHIVTLGDERLQNSSLALAKRFPYVVAVTRNSSALWPFACFASVVLYKWIVTSAHCRRAASVHRAILYNDFVRNRTYAFPIKYWRVHEKFNITNPTPKYDIAVARLDVASYPYPITTSDVDEGETFDIEASVWKTVSTMDKKLYLTNSFDKYDLKLANPGKCFESYGVELDESLFCVDTSDYEDCFVHDFGPIFSGDKLVGLLAVKPQDCDMRLAIFTNVSYYTNWILRTTHDR